MTQKPHSWAHRGRSLTLGCSIHMLPELATPQELPTALAAPHSHPLLTETRGQMPRWQGLWDLGAMAAFLLTDTCARSALKYIEHHQGC